MRVKIELGKQYNFGSRIGSLCLINKLGNTIWKLGVMTFTL